MEEKIDSTKRRFETLDIELKRREREMDDANKSKADLQNQIQALKATVKGWYGYFVKQRVQLFVDI